MSQRIKINGRKGRRSAANKTVIEVGIVAVKSVIITPKFEGFVLEIEEENIIKGNKGVYLVRTEDMLLLAEEGCEGITIDRENDRLVIDDVICVGYSQKDGWHTKTNTFKSDEVSYNHP